MNRLIKENLLIKYQISKLCKSINFKFLTIIILFFISYIALYLWVDTSSQSLIAHDEGLYARRARLLEQSDNWFSPPFQEVHHKTLGSYWLIALAIKFCGLSELSIRFPSFVCSFISVLIVYFITRELSSNKAAIISVISLISMPLWVQYSKYASPDMAFVTSILISIYLLIKAFSQSSRNKLVYLFFSSFSLSIGFFLRSYMILIPCIALSPYIFFNLKEDKFKSYIALVLGFILGFVPTVLNLYFAYKLYSSEGITSLFDFARNQAIGPSIIKNLSLIPLNIFYLTFPIGLIVILLFIFTKPNRKINSPLLIYGYPLISTLILLSMSKSYAHYFLFLLPSLAIYSSMYIDSFTYKYWFSLKAIKYLLLFVIVIMTITVFSSAFIYKFGFIEHSIDNIRISLFISALLMTSYILAIDNILFRSFQDNLFKLILLISLPQILSLNLLYNSGIVGNPNKTIKNFLTDKSFMEISTNNKLYLLSLNSKTNTLLSYYLPSSKKIHSIESLPNNSYLITSNPNLSSDLKITNAYKLIRTFGSNYLFFYNLN